MIWKRYPGGYATALLARRPLNRLRKQAAPFAPVAGRAVKAEVVTSDVGPLALHSEDRWITPTIRATGTWEPEEAAWLRRAITPGGLVVDVGAHVGYFTLLASLVAGDSGAVLAIEPDAANVALLRQNVARRRNVVIAAAAASDRLGTLALRRSASNTGDHQVYERQRPGDELVSAVPLDALLHGLTLDVAKIDAQGFDHHVVAGLRETLRRSPAAQLLVEFWLAGMRERALDPADVLAGYRELGRPLGLLNERGCIREASDEQILSTAAGWEGQFTNVVIGPSAASAK